MSWLSTAYQHLYNWGLSDPVSFERYQAAARTLEWQAVEHYIPYGSAFLDIGCGKGHSMSLAWQHRGCTCTGVDPYPQNAGASPLKKDGFIPHIVEGWAENLPFDNATFDVVYSSHMLEHTSNYSRSLAEMARVVKPSGVVIIGVPTASMVIVRLISSLIFTLHRTIFELLRWPFRSSEYKRKHPLLSLITPISHGKEDKTVFYDLYDYRIEKWQERVKEHFDIENTVLPGLYPFPDFYQWFKPITGSKMSSSIFIIAKPRHA